MSEAQITSARTYVITWLILLGLLALTLASSFLRLGGMNVVVNLAISFTQATIVLLFSMHLRGAHPTLKIVAASGFFGILLMIVLTLADELTR